MSLRVLKKDIEFLVNDFIEDCVLYLELHPGKHDEEVRRIIFETIDFANDLFYRVNHFDKKSNVKEHFKAIKKKKKKGLDAFCDRLSEVARS